jgi:hypothetical protein
MTHESGGPWHSTWEKEPGRRSMDIEDSLIKNAFKEKIQAASQ